MTESIRWRESRFLRNCLHSSRAALPASLPKPTYHEPGCCVDELPRSGAGAPESLVGSGLFCGTVIAWKLGSDGIGFCSTAHPSRICRVTGQSLIVKEASLTSPGGHFRSLIRLPKRQIVLFVSFSVCMPPLNKLGFPRRARRDYACAIPLLRVMTRAFPLPRTERPANLTMSAPLSLSAPHLQAKDFTTSPTSRDSNHDSVSTFPESVAGSRARAASAQRLHKKQDLKPSSSARIVAGQSQPRCRP